MKQDQNKKLYYKMYKKGRFWIFAGMAVVTMNMGVVTSHADATTQSSSEPATSSTSEKSVVSQSQVVLQSSATTNQSSSVSDASSAADAPKTATETSKATETTTAKEQSEKDSETGTQAQPVESSSSSETKSTSAASDVKDTTVTNEETAKLAPVSDEPVATTKPESTLPVENGDTAKEGLTTAEVGETDLTSENETSEFNNQLTLNNLQETTTNAIGAVAVQKLSRAALVKAAAVIESGNKLGLDYTITDDGTLTIQGGNLQDTSTGAGSPWRDSSSKITKVVIAGPIVASKNMSSLFDQLGNVTEFIGLDKIDVSAVTDMSYLFRSDAAVQNLDLSSWASKTGNLTNLDNAFYGTNQLKTLNLNNWDVSKVTSMQQTFDMGDWMTPSSIEEIDVDNWDTSSVRNMSNLFGDNAHLTKLDLSTWKHTGNVTNMQSMFNGDASLSSLDVSGFDTSKVTMIGGMFQGVGVSTLDVSNFDTSSVETADSMFASMQHVTSITFGENFKLANATVSLLFYQDYRLQSLDLSNFLVPNTKQNYRMFTDDVNLKKLTLGANVNLNQVELKPGNPQPVVGLPEITPTAKYTGKWVDETNQNGPAYTSAELTQLYDGTNGPDGVTYIWQITSLSKLTTKDEVSLVAGSKTTWSPKDSVIEVLDESGKPLDLTTVDSFVKIISVNGDTAGTVDASKAGTYVVVLAYTDATGVTQTAQTTVHVVENKATIMTEPETVVAGPKAVFDLKAAIKGLTDVNGDAIDIDQALADKQLVADLSQLDLSKTGDQLVKVTYTDTTGTSHEATVTVHVVATKADLQASGTTVVAGPSAPVWQATDNFVSAKDADGQALTLDDVDVTGDVDTTTPGEYTVTYRYTDKAGNDLSQTVTVKVNASQATVVVKDATVTAGSTAKWTPNDSFVSGTDADGQALTLNDVQVTGTVDMATPGTYTITYQYTDVAGNVVKATAKVTVVAATDPDTDDNGSTGTGDQIDPDQPTTPTDPATKPGYVTTTADHSQIDPEQPMTIAAKMGTGRILPAEQATESQAKSVSTLPQTDEVQSNSKQDLGMTLLALTGLTGLLGLARKRRHN